MIEAKITRGFGSDNHASVHPEVLDALRAHNLGHAPAYGTDEITAKAKEVFRRHFGPKAHPFFVFNGTAANVLSFRALLQSHEAIMTTSTAHIAVDECGAPEFHGGHKLLTIASTDGKLRPADLEPLLIRLGDQHAVQPRLVSITQPTELGTVYSINELRALKDFCLQKNLMLHIDGARFANAATHLNCELAEISSEIGADVLSLGGTKNGLLGAEAVIFFGEHPPAAFKYIQKQELQLSSKTRFLAAQFLAYLEGDLWRRVARRSLGLAQELRAALTDIPEIEITQATQSNAVFARIPKAWTKPLKEACFFYVWDETDWVVRLMLSHDNTSEDIARFRECALALRRQQNRGI